MSFFFCPQFKHKQRFNKAAAFYAVNFFRSIQRVFSKLIFKKKDPFLQFLDNSIYLKSVPRYAWGSYKYQRTNAKCIGVFKIYIKESILNLHVVLRIYKGNTWPINYAAKWSFGDDTVKDGLFNISHNSPPMIGRGDFAQFIRQLTASIHGMRVMHSFYRFNTKPSDDSVYETKSVPDKEAFDK